MSRLKVSELFYSLQGEGRYQGVPSVFLRLFGCNFTCSGFGMPAGQKSDERLLVDATKYTDYKQLPLVKTGCDSYASWDPRFKHLSKFYESYDLANDMLALLPNGSWRGVHLVITGGEPLLAGWQKQLPSLIERVVEDGCRFITFETNGTQALTNDLCEHFGYMSQYEVEFTFSVSPKLSASGEDWNMAICPEVVRGYQGVTEAIGCNSQVYLKFVVDKPEHLFEVERALDAYDIDCPVYLMPVGGTGDLYFINNKQVAEWALARGWRYSARLQVDLWKNAWGT